MAEKGLAFLLRKAAAVGTSAVVVTATEIWTATAHGLVTGNAVTFTTTGTLPAATGFAINKIFYVNVPDANTFTLHTTKAQAIADSNVIDFTTTGTGTHTVKKMETIAGLRNTSFSLSGESVDVTTKDSAGQWRQLLGGAGVSTMTFSGDGVFQDNSNLTQIQSDVAGRVLDVYSAVVESGDEFAGLFQPTTVDNAGVFNGERTYSLTLENGGVVQFIDNI